MDSTPPPRFYTETVTLAEHQLLKRIRQLCKEDGTVVLVIEITTREDMQAGSMMKGTLEEIKAEMKKQEGAADGFLVPCNATTEDLMVELAFKRFQKRVLEYTASEIAMQRLE